MTKPIERIAVLAYPRCGEQDTLVPWEILKSLAWRLQEDDHRSLQVVLLGITPDRQVTMQMGANVSTEATATAADLYDLFFVPGGMGSGDASKNEQILDLVRRHYEAGKIIATNCSGISILHRARILSDTRITAPTTVSRRLVQEGANLSDPRRMWIGVPDRRLWTTVGGSGVHGSTVAMIAHYFGRERGRDVAMMWDTLPCYGDAIFELEGPEYRSYPKYERWLQEDLNLEEILLPKIATESLHRPQETVRT
jgi:putative intracellular protease/amidase